MNVRRVAGAGVLIATIGLVGVGTACASADEQQDEQESPEQDTPESEGGEGTEDEDGED